MAGSTGREDGSNPTRDEVQRERARQAWSLAIDASFDALPAGDRKQLLRLLRVKRSERPAFTARLPGVVRRGARVDLADLYTTLREAGLPARLFASPAPGERAEPAD